MSISKHLGKPHFRSDREKRGYAACAVGTCSLMILPPALAESSVSASIAWALAVGVVGLGAWDAWQRWGRERFPLPPPDGLQPTE